MLNEAKGGEKEEKTKNAKWQKTELKTEAENTTQQHQPSQTVPREYYFENTNVWLQNKIIIFSSQNIRREKNFLKL